MPKINVGLGLTVQLGEDSREFARPSVEITDIDTEGDIEAQISQAVVACIKVWDAETKLLYDKVVELSGGPNPNLQRRLEEGLREVFPKRG